jgi:vancomycin resistance protein YoaR
MIDGDQAWPLATAQTPVTADLADAVNRAYLYGRSDHLLADLAAQLRSALLGAAITPQMTIDPAPLQAAVGEIAARVGKPGVAARTIGAVTVPAQPGLTVDVPSTVATLLDALQTAPPDRTVTVPLATTVVPPPAPAPAIATNDALRTLAVVEPIVLTAREAGLALALDPARLQAMATSLAPLALDEAALRAYLTELAAQIATPARDARLRFNPATGGVTVLQTSRPGRALDIDATVQAVQAAVAASQPEAPLVVQNVAPAVDMDSVAEMGIRELVATGSTYFAGSSASRLRNIEVAAEKFDGIVIPPDGIFSFNDVVRDVSAANGFEDSLVIWGDRTAVGVGGGVCQVSTTIFRSAYQGGFPIVERYNHGYVVDWYGEPGMDATIFTPSVDFRFRNDTGSYLLLEPVMDAANGVLTMNFYGTKPDRTITVSEPEVTEVVQPEPPSYVVDETLTEGEQKQVEWQKDGMTTRVTRTIVENGTTRTDTLVSKYQPWRAVYLVGPGTAIPEEVAAP